jgi:hypothetical protein
MIYSRSSSPEYLLLVFFFFLSWWRGAARLLFSFIIQRIMHAVSDVQNGRHILCILLRKRTKNWSFSLESITSIIKGFSFHSFSCNIIASVSIFFCSRDMDRKRLPPLVQAFLMSLRYFSELNHFIRSGYSRSVYYSVELQPRRKRKKKKSESETAEK